MKRITTETGSVYELDEDNKRIRRLTGTKAATERQGTDGEWKPYEEIEVNQMGVLITWSYGDGALGSNRCTLTSPLKLVETLP